MRTAALVVVLAILLAGISPFGASAAGTADTSVAHPDDSVARVDAVEAASTQSSFARQSAIDWSPETVITVKLDGSGNANWQISFRYTLDDSNETAAFRRYGEAFEAGQADIGIDADFFRRVAAKASTVTGRDMRIRNVSQSARIRNDTGVLTLSFVWTDMLGQTENGHLRLRDAFLLPSGKTWLATLEPDQRLVIQTPSGYTVSSASTQVIPRNNSVIIPGPRDFSASDPLTIVYKEAEPAVETTATTPPPETEVPWDVLVGGVVAVAIIGTLLAAGRIIRRESSEAESGEAAEVEPAGEVQREEVPEEPAVEEEPTEEDLSLLSDEERVERLLERHDGRMKQATIVDETGWSDAKVSQLLSAMADEGRIEKLRMGRENIISLPDYEESEE